LTPVAVVARIAAIIAAAELLIMLVLGGFEHSAGMLTEAVVDSTALVVVSTPLIYLWVIRPFVAARDQALARVSQMAFTDPLTGLPNRRLLTAHLEKFRAADARHGVHGAFLLIDLDRFKEVNDVHGHDAGDTLLVEVARRLQSITRAEDVVGRLGGDEFAVLIGHLDADPDLARQRAVGIAEKMLELVSRTVSYQGAELRVHASIGVRLLDSSVPDIDTALREADRAMYVAKAAKGRHVAVFEASATAGIAVAS